MAYQGDGIVRIPAGLAGLALRENRLLAQPEEYIDANGVTFEEHHIRKEAGATSFDTDGIGGAPSYSGTLGASDGWAGNMNIHRGSAIAVGGTAATKDATALSLTQTVTVPAGGYAIDSLVVVVVAWTSLTTTIVSVTDTQGNSYVASGSRLLGVTIVDGQMQVFRSKLGTALAAGNTITITFTTINSLGAIVVGNFTGLNSATPTGTAGQSSNPTTIVKFGPAPPNPAPYLATVGLGASTESFAPGGTPAFTELVELNGTNATAALHYRIDTTSPTIIALHDWLSDVATAGAGTVSTTAGSTTVTGDGATVFTTAVFKRDFIQIGTERRKVATITDNDTLDTEEAWAVTNAPGTAYTIRVGQRIISATTAGTLLKERADNLDAVTLSSSLSQVARPGRFVQGGKEAAALNRKLFYFNGVDSVRVLSGDGATVSVITSPPTDWATTNQPFNGTIHRSRLAAWGNLNDPHRVYISDPDDHEDFTTPEATSLRVASNVGDRLVGGVSFNGVLFLWKHPRGIFYIDDSSLNPSEWVVFTKSEAIGCAASQYAVLPMDDDVLFLAANGTFHILSAVDTLGGVRDSDLGYHLGIAKWLRENLNLAKLDQASSVWYSDKKVALFGVPGTGETTNTLTLKFDFAGVTQGHPIKFSYTERDFPDALAIRRSDTDGVERPMLGESGFVFLLDQAARNKEDLAYTGTYQTPHLDFSHVDADLEYTKKNYDALELIMEPVSAGTLTVEVYVDTVLRETLTFDATKRRDRQTLHCGGGFMISLVVTNSVLDEDFRVLSHNFFFTAGGQDYNVAV